MEELKENKKKVFTVPKGYFEQLNKEIMMVTAGNSTPTADTRHHTIGRFWRIAGYAAAIVLLLGVASTLYSPKEETGNNTVITVIANEETDSYSEYIDNIFNSYDIDEYTFYCYLTDSDFE